MLPFGTRVALALIGLSIPTSTALAVAAAKWRLVGSDLTALDRTIAYWTSDAWTDVASPPHRFVVALAQGFVAAVPETQATLGAPGWSVGVLCVDGPRF